MVVSARIITVSSGKELLSFLQGSVYVQQSEAVPETPAVPPVRIAAVWHWPIEWYQKLGSSAAGLLLGLLVWAGWKDMRRRK